MPKQMTLFVPAVLASLLAASSSTSMSARAEPAADECLTGPDRQAPEGSHWYYHLDRVSHRKCWFLGPLDAKVRRVPVAKLRQPAKPAPAPAPAPTDEASTEQPMAQMFAQAALAQDLRDRSGSPRGLPSMPTAALDGAPASTSEPDAAEPTRMLPADEAPPDVAAVASASLSAAEQSPAPASLKDMLPFLAGSLVAAAVIGRMVLVRVAAPRRTRRAFFDCADRPRNAARTRHRFAPDLDMPHDTHVDTGDESEELRRRLEKAWGLAA